MQVVAPRNSVGIQRCAPPTRFDDKQYRVITHRQRILPPAIGFHDLAPIGDGYAPDASLVSVEYAIAVLVVKDMPVGEFRRRRIK